MPTTRIRPVVACVLGATLLALPVSAQEGVELAIGDARDLLHERSTDLVVQDSVIEQAALLEDQARSVLLPGLNVSFSYNLRDREITFEQPNAYAPLTPYLTSVYDSDPRLRQFFDDNPDVVDARDLAQLESLPITVQFRHDYRAVATLSQTIFDAQAFPLLDQADTIYEQSQNVRDQIVYELEAGLLALYFNALVLQRFITIGERNLELEQLAHQRAVAAYEEEIGNRFEVNRAEVRLRRAELDVANARREYDVAIEALRIFLNADGPFDVVMPPELEPPADYQELLAEALETRPELRGSELAIQLAEERVSETRSTWWPTLVAQFQTVVLRQSAFTGDPFSWNLGVFLNWDIWDGGLRLAETQSRRLEIAQERAILEQTIRNIESDIRQTAIQIESGVGQIDTARAEAGLAAQNVELTQSSLELGAATQLDLETARTQAFLAALNLARTEIAVQAVIYEVYRLAGRYNR